MTYSRLQDLPPTGPIEATSRLLLVDADSLHILMASPAARAALGYTETELAGLTFPDIAPEVTGAALHRLSRRMVARGSSATDFATPLRRNDGERLATRVRLHRIGVATQSVFCVSLDAAQSGTGTPRRYELDAALLKSVIDTAPDAIVTIDRDGTISGFSPSAERMFGYAAGEVTGRNVSCLMPEPYRAQHDSYIARYLDTGEKRIIGIGRTVIARHKSGRTFPIELAVGEVLSGGTHVFTGFIRDISDRVAAQARVSRLQQELNHVSRLSAMGEIASMIVHELNQPLTAIANFGEAAKRLVETGDPEHRAPEFIEKAVAQAHRASEMIRRLRDFVSRGSTERELIAVNEVVRDASRLALIGAADQQVRTSFDLAGDLPRVTADRIQIQQVVVNLIRNAIDAMVGAGEVAPDCAMLAIESRSEDADGSVTISVADNGPGLAAEIAGQLFTPFVTTKKDGMGIGLSVSRSIVEAHGGRIWAEARPAGGTRFSFTLPTTPLVGPDP
jgi:two-component system sensor kinase FixL